MVSGTDFSRVCGIGLSTLQPTYFMCFMCRVGERKINNFTEVGTSKNKRNFLVQLKFWNKKLLNVAVWALSLCFSQSFTNVIFVIEAGKENYSRVMTRSICYCLFLTYSPLPDRLFNFLFHILFQNVLLIYSTNFRTNEHKWFLNIT